MVRLGSRPVAPLSDTSLSGDLQRTRRTSGGERYALMIAGLGALGFVARRRKPRTA